MNKSEDILAGIKRRLETQKKIVEDFDADIRRLQEQRQVAAQHLRFLQANLEHTIEDFDKRNTTMKQN